jgi:hypothetical protein
VHTEVVARIAGAEIEALDPRTMAARWSAALDAPVTHSSEADCAIRLEDGELHFVLAGHRGEGLSAVTLEATDVQAALAVAHNQGLQTHANGFRLCGTRFDLLAPARGS